MPFATETRAIAIVFSAIFFIGCAFVGISFDALLVTPCTSAPVGQRTNTARREAAGQFWPSTHVPAVVRCCVRLRRYRSGWGNRKSKRIVRKHRSRPPMTGCPPAPTPRCTAPHRNPARPRASEAHKEAREPVAWRLFTSRTSPVPVRRVFSHRRAWSKISPGRSPGGGPDTRISETPTPTRSRSGSAQVVAAGRQQGMELPGRCLTRHTRLLLLRCRCRAWVKVRSLRCCCCDEWQATG